MKRKIKEIIKWMYHLINRRLKPVNFGELSDVPVSRKMGFDRGTPIDRYYIEKFLKNHKRFIKGRLMEVAEDKYMSKFATKASEKYILSYEDGAKGENVIKGDLTNPSSVQNCKINCFICTQTLNFIYDIKRAMEGIYALLAPKGYALITVSGVSQLSRYDYDRWGDYWRFTDLSIKRLVGEVFGEKNIKIFTYGNLASSIAFFQGLSVEDLPSKELLNKRDKDYQCIIGIVVQKN